MPGFRIAITLDLRHSFGNLFDTMMLFIISFSHTVALGPRCLICSHSMSSKPAGLLFLMILMPFISSSMVNGDARECSVMWLSVSLAFDGRCVEFPLPFNRSSSPSTVF